MREKEREHTHTHVCKNTETYCSSGSMQNKCLSIEGGKLCLILWKSLVCWKSLTSHGNKTASQYLPSEIYVWSFLKFCKYRGGEKFVWYCWSTRSVEKSQTLNGNKTTSQYVPSKTYVWSFPKFCKYRGWKSLFDIVEVLEKSQTSLGNKIASQYVSYKIYVWSFPKFCKSRTRTEENYRSFYLALWACGSDFSNEHPFCRQTYCCIISVTHARENSLYLQGECGLVSESTSPRYSCILLSFGVPYWSVARKK